LRVRSVPSAATVATKPHTSTQTPMRLTDDMLYTPDAATDALKKHPAWAQFHRLAGQRGLYFDFITKKDRRYYDKAFRMEKNDLGGWVSYELASGSGKTPLEALEAAYRGSGKVCEELDRLMDDMAGRSLVEEDSFDALFD
jgi:hypothetical protein